MRAGEYKHKIEIQIFKDIKNEFEENEKMWTHFKKVWAKKQRLRALVQIVEGKENIVYIYRFTLRYRTDLTEDMRIIYKGDIYDITDINPISDNDRYETVIECRKNIGVKNYGE